MEIVREKERGREGNTVRDIKKGREIYRNTDSKREKEREIVVIRRKREK
jgi:hypothetical protein